MNMHIHQPWETRSRSRDHACSSRRRYASSADTLYLVVLNEYGRVDDVSSLTYVKQSVAVQNSRVLRKQRRSEENKETENSGVESPHVDASSSDKTAHQCTRSGVGHPTNAETRTPMPDVIVY